MELIFDAPIHATCVAHHGRGVLILGAAGSGKSGLALQLIALGAILVADDGVQLSQTEIAIVADCPDAIQGIIEARGIGLLQMPVCGPVPLHLIVDMDVIEKDRLPPRRIREIGSHVLPLVHKSDSSHFPAAVLLYLTHGRSE